MPKCSACGFLFAIDPTTDEAIEASLNLRQRGVYAPKGPAAGTLRTASQDAVHCWMRRPEFPERLPEEGPHAIGRPLVLTRISVDVPCPSFTQYSPGRTAKDYENMDIVAEVRRLTKEREDAEAARHAAHRAEDVAWRKEVEDANGKRDHRRDKKQLTTILIAVCALLVAIATAIANWVRALQ